MPVFRQTKGVAEKRSEGRSFRTTSLICASRTIAFGLLTFSRWIFGLLLLAIVRAKYIPMAPSTALCFSVIGIGLIAHLRRPGLRWKSGALASFVFAMACAKLIEILGVSISASTPGSSVIPNISGQCQRGEWHR